MCWSSSPPHGHRRLSLLFEALPHSLLPSILLLALALPNQRPRCSTYYSRSTLATWNCQPSIAEPRAGKLLSKWEWKLVEMDVTFVVLVIACGSAFVSNLLGSWSGSGIASVSASASANASAHHRHHHHNHSDNHNQP